MTLTVLDSLSYNYNNLKAIKLVKCLLVVYFVKTY